MFPKVTGNLSSIMNIVPALDKLTIIPLKKATPVPLPTGPPYVVQFNPEKFDEKHSIIYNAVQAIGATGADNRFNRIQPRRFSFEFLIDGTGASGDKREVIAEIELFKTIVGFKGALHRPGFLLLVWGVHVVTAVAKDYTINYSLYRKNGTPLRATITVNFDEHKDSLFQIIEQALQSPDLTSRHIVKEGDSLPLMCNTVYDDPRHYLEVARANKLTNFRKLKTGAELDFPPIKKE